MIKLSIPHLNGHEKAYVDEAVESTWITPLGPFVDRFEKSLDSYLGCDHTVALSAGTAAIHLALLLAGVKPGDEVVCQSFTFAASANPITYIGATPVFVDSEPSTWNLDPETLKIAIEDRIRRTGRKPAAIVVVDLYGMSADYESIKSIADSYEIPLIEDACEALGSEYNGRKCGLFGAYGTLSFNGNKMITTSGGGALICPDKATAERALFLATQARENRPYYYHETVGYNYRLSNVSAAIGCAQMLTLNDRVARRREIHSIYRREFASNPFITLHDNPDERFNSNFWLSTITLADNAPIDADALRQRLLANDIESRLLWRPLHLQPVFANAPAYTNGCSEALFNRGLCLPSSSTLSDEEVLAVAKLINSLTVK